MAGAVWSLLRVANTKSFFSLNAHVAGLGGLIDVNARNSFPRVNRIVNEGIIVSEKEVLTDDVVGEVIQVLLCVSQRRCRSSNVTHQVISLIACTTSRKFVVDWQDTRLRTHRKDLWVNRNQIKDQSS